jgi:hypothetical protein
MMVGYATFLIFQLVTHRYLYDGDLMAGEAPIKVAAAAAVSLRCVRVGARGWLGGARGTPVKVAAPHVLTPACLPPPSPPLPPARSREASTESAASPRPRAGAGGPPPRPLLQQALTKAALQGPGGSAAGLSQRRVSVLATSDLELIPLGAPPHGSGGGGGGGGGGECRIEVAAAEAAATATAASSDTWDEGDGLIAGRGPSRGPSRGAEVRGGSARAGGHAGALLAFATTRPGTAAPRPAPNLPPSPPNPTHPPTHPPTYPGGGGGRRRAGVVYGGVAAVAGGHHRAHQPAVGLHHGLHQRGQRAGGGWWGWGCS